MRFPSTMRFPSARGAAAAMIFTAAAVLAAPTSYCSVPSQVCFQWAVPQAAAGSGSGNVYFQLRAPTSYSWVALGIGSQMQGADMFVMYQDGNGNVTLSTRTAAGHVEPSYRENKGVTLLAGSGVAGGQMVANVRCADCSRLTLGGTNRWISAWKQGGSIASKSDSAQISYHDGHDQFSLDFAKASVSADENPFAARGGNGGGGGGNISPGSSAVVRGGNDERTLLHAHGVIMLLVFVVGFPAGSMLMPLLGKWFLHAGWQTVFFLLMWAGFGTGYVLAHDLGMFFKQAHTRLGLVICVLVCLQPVLGWLHHLHFAKHQRRGAISHAHIWYGRALMVLAIVNGGLGVELAGSKGPWVAAYSVLAAIFVALYLASTALGVVRRRAGRGRNKV